MADALVVINFLVALFYYIIAGLIVFAPLRYGWVRSLGWLWGVPASFAAVFFIGCGSHHVHWATDLIENPLLVEGGEFWHFIFIDGIQPIAAATVVALAIRKGDTMVERLIEMLVRHRPELIQRLIDRLVRQSGAGA